MFENTGEPRQIVHKFGDVSDNPWHTANQLDVPRCRWGKGRNIMNLGDGDYICTACDAEHTYYPCIRGGDEVIACCPDCGSLESIERKL